MTQMRPSVHRPLEKRRDWALSILGLIALGIGGYLLEDRLVSSLLAGGLVVFIAAVVQHYRRNR
jgi:hypothetical protein